MLRGFFNLMDSNILVFFGVAIILLFIIIFILMEVVKILFEQSPGVINEDWQKARKIFGAKKT